MSEEKCDYIDACRRNREDEITFRASLQEQMKGAVKELSEIACSIKTSNEEYWKAIGKLGESISQEKADRITADGHIESKLSFEKGRAVGYAVLISTIIGIMGIVLGVMMK